MLRLFVAIPLPDGIVARLRIMCSGIAGAHWVEATNMHITLRFIGEVDEATAADIDPVLAQIEADAFSLELAELGTFGQGSRARSLWVGVTPSAFLTRLQSKIETALVRFGLPPEGRKFTPHVTLARLKRPEPGRIQSFIEGNNLFRAGPFAVEHFTLLDSRRGKGGPVYIPLADYALQSQP